MVKILKIKILINNFVLLVDIDLSWELCPDPDAAPDAIVRISDQAKTICNNTKNNLTENRVNLVFTQFCIKYNLFQV